MRFFRLRDTRSFAALEAARVVGSVAAFVDRFRSPVLGPDCRVLGVSMDRSTLKASDVEALCYIYGSEGQSPSAGRADWCARSFPLLSATALVAGAVVILAIVWRVLRL